MTEILKKILLGAVSNDNVRKFINNELNEEEIKNLSDAEIPNDLAEWVEFKDLGPALSMIGYKRLTNLEHLVTDIVNNKVEGSFIETGVWKGGACMFVKYLFNKYNVNKKVYVADSFQGLPIPNPDKYPKDLNDIHHTYDFLKISQKDVKNNFSKFNLLDDNVIFLKGWFSETLPKVDDKFAIIRLDGDMYESTMDALTNLYDKLSINGYVIIDDFSFIACSDAVNDFRRDNGIVDEMIKIDSSSIYWKKTKNK
jgi:O-methyltransferase